MEYVANRLLSDQTPGHPGRPRPTTEELHTHLGWNHSTPCHAWALVEDRFAISEVVGALTRLDTVPGLCRAPNRAAAAPGGPGRPHRRCPRNRRPAVPPSPGELQEARTAVEKVSARLTERYSEVEEVPTEVSATTEATPAP